jgi:hypothetical protein
MLERGDVRMKVKGKKIRKPKTYKKLRQKQLRAGIAAKIAKGKKRRKK